MLTDAQATTLAAAIRASTDPVVVTALAIRDDVGLTAYYNAASTFIVWKTRVTQDEIMRNGFDWVLVDNLSVGKARIWDWLFANDQRVIDPSKDNVRAGISECWKGTAAMLAQQAIILGHCKRPATRCEALFTTGTGTDAAPGALTVEGQISTNELSTALNKNP